MNPERGETRVVLDPAYGWKSEERDGVSFHWIGSGADVGRLKNFFSERDDWNDAALADVLNRTEAHFGFIAQGVRGTVACADRMRSYPVFFSARPGEFLVGNSARLLRERTGAGEIDELSFLEFRAAGYVSGPDTLIRGISQARAGEFVRREAASGKTDFRTYARFAAAEDAEDGDAENESRFVEELEQASLAVFGRLARRLEGKRIWVPLSGGWDSRLIAALLKTCGHSDVRAFTYGPPGNSEMKYARAAAERLGIPWHFVPGKCAESRKNFWTARREEYWRFSDFLATVPVMLDFQAIASLVDSGAAAPGDVVINGHSGDFTSGGHVPDLPTGKSGADAVFEKLLVKHYALWPSLVRPEEAARLKDKFLSIMGTDGDVGLSEARAASLFGEWEWRERQSKYVVASQRKYEFLGLGWELPLWERELFEFWKKVPLKLKRKQKLYESYLVKTDPGGVFRGLGKAAGRWPGVSAVVPWIARAARLFGGKRASDAVYRRLLYWGHYRPFYCPYGYRNYLKAAPFIRNPVSLHVRQWVRENFPDKAGAFPGG